MQHQGSSRGVKNTLLPLLKYKQALRARMRVRVRTRVPTRARVRACVRTRWHVCATFSIAEQTAYLSSRLTLHSGDVTLTAKPTESGTEPASTLGDGDAVRVEIAGLSQLTTTVTSTT